MAPAESSRARSARTASIPPRKPLAEVAKAPENVEQLMEKPLSQEQAIQQRVAQEHVLEKSLSQRSWSAAAQTNCAKLWGKNAAASAAIETSSMPAVSSGEGRLSKGKAFLLALKGVSFGQASAAIVFSALVVVILCAVRKYHADAGLNDLMALWEVAESAGERFLCFFQSQCEVVLALLSRNDKQRWIQSIMDMGTVVSSALAEMECGMPALMGFCAVSSMALCVFMIIRFYKGKSMNALKGEAKAV